MCRYLDDTPCHLAKQAVITILTIFVDASLVCSVHSSRLHLEGVSFCGWAARAFVTGTYQMGFTLLAVTLLRRCVVTRLSKLVCGPHVVFRSDLDNPGIIHFLNIYKLITVCSLPQRQQLRMRWNRWILNVLLWFWPKHFGKEHEGGWQEKNGT